jgi:hypothetical protein
MIRPNVTACLVAVALQCAPAFAALEPTPEPSPVPRTKIEQMLPASGAAAGFLNVRRVFALYGDLIQQSHYYGQLEQLLQAGFPDPSKDLDQLGAVADLTKDSHQGGLVISGTLNMEKLMALAQQMGITYTPSIYRGVTLLDTKLKHERIQAGFVDEKTTLVAFENKDGQAMAHSMVDTLKGAPNYGETNHLALSDKYLANLSLKISEALRPEWIKNLPRDLKVLGDLDFATASLTAEETTKEGFASVDFTMTNEDSAKILEAKIIEAVREAQQNNTGGQAGNEFFSKVKVTRNGKTVNASVTVPRKLVEDLVSGH